MGIPIFINENFFKILLIGGGAVAYKKAKKFSDAGFYVSVAAQNIDGRFYDLEKCTCEIRTYNKNILEEKRTDHKILIAATNNDELNKLISADGDNLGYIFLNISDGNNSAFNLMGYREKNSYLISTFTFGRSPAISKRILDIAEISLENEMDDIIELLGELRVKLKRKISDKELMSRSLRYISSLTKDQLIELNELREEELLKYFLDQGDNL